MRRVVIGVTAGIAAYKACDLVSELRERGVATRAAMTPRATRFLGPLTLAALTGAPVLVDDLEDAAAGGGAAGAEIPHVALARWAEAVVVAPATADFLGRLAHGIADDSLGAMLLALEPEKPLVLAPAMNTRMWENPLVRANVERLRHLWPGIRFVEPVAKRLACGEEGIGGLAAPADIAAAVVTALDSSDARGAESRDDGQASR